MESDRYFVLDCVIAPESNSISRGNQHIHLEPKVMDCLIFFLHHSGEILSRDELIHSVWHGRVVNEEAVNRIIYQIRSAFHELGITQKLLVTHRKRGYQWILHVEHSHQAAPKDIEEITTHTNQFRWIVTLSVTLCIVILFTGFALWPSSDTSSASVNATRQISINISDNLNRTNSEQINTIIKLLLIDLNTQPNTQAKLNEDNSIHSQYTLDFDTAKDSLNESSQYSVSYKILGNIQWSGSFEVPKNIATRNSQYREIIENILPASNHDEWSDACLWPREMAALEHYFNARAVLSRRGKDALLQTIEHLNLAINISPNFAKAFSLKAFTYSLLIAHESPEKNLPSTLSYSDLANLAANRALQICPTSAEAYTVNGDIEDTFKTNKLSREYFRIQHALTIDPDNAEIAMLAGEFYWRVGFLNMATEWFEKAARLDPLSGVIQANLANILLHQGDIQAAHSTLLKAKSFGYNDHKAKQLSWLRIALARNDLATANTELQYLSLKEQPIISAYLDWYSEPTSINIQKLESELDSAINSSHESAFLAYQISLLAKKYATAERAWTASLPRIKAGHTFWWPGSGERFNSDTFQSWLKDDGFYLFWQQVGLPDTCRWERTKLICHH